MMLLPDLRMLQLFVAVAREGNVSRAAEQVHLSQPAVSLQLKRLGRHTGVAIFRRTAHGLELTQAGAILAKKAEQVLAAAGDFAGTAQRLAAKLSGSLRIGTIIDPEFIRLGAFLKAVAEGGGTIKTELYHGMSGDVLNRIRSGGLDAGFYLGDIDTVPSSDRSASDASPVFQAIPLAPLRYRVIASPSWQSLLDGRDWRGLASLPWIGTSPLSVHNRLLSRRFEAAGAVQNVVAVADQEASMLALARTGIGLCLCREDIALRERQAQGLAIADGLSVETTLSFVVPKTRASSPLIELAMAAVERAWA